uniref:SWIM-type domain-containing protein n=1 Tax=Bursaphelenchus xylophilus TaxID=6326 RepID=A0A1I7SWX3_BURXY
MSVFYYPISVCPENNEDNVAAPIVRRCDCVHYFPETGMRYFAWCKHILGDVLVLCGRFCFYIFIFFFHPFSSNFGCFFSSARVPHE